MDIVDELNDGRAPYVFVIHGQLCHRISPFEARAGYAPSYCQLYFFDGREALNQRMNRNTDLRRDTMELLQRTLQWHHQYAPAFRHAYEIMRDYALAGRSEIQLSLHCLTSNDRRRYNLSTTDEVAVILPNSNDWDKHEDHRDILLRYRDGGLLHISEAHPAYACLHYVLLFPRGEHGWHRNLFLHIPDSEFDAEPDMQSTQPRSRRRRGRRHRTTGDEDNDETNNWQTSQRQRRERLTLTRYLAFRLFPRSNEFSTILRGGRLFQQYIVDLWAQADQQRLNYIRTHQADIRACLYSGLVDAVGTGGDVDLHSVGQKVILPSSYIGGARHMHQVYQDSMAIARYFHKVDLFITMTCNPKWPEITRELLPGQQPNDRPDLVARVFKMKKQAFLDDIFKHGIFGRAVARVWTIEFQKRGLPHMHRLVWLEDDYKLRTPEDVDTCIRSYWPDPNSEPQLFEAVKEFMVHVCNEKRCLGENGICTKAFPHRFQDFTTMDHDGYPHYYCPNDGRRYEKDGQFYGNEHIVPYNPYLMVKYRCHINVECAFSVGSVKYIHKYIFKGHDRATMEIHARDDEVSRFLDGRYIGPPEAVWRTLHLSFTRRFQILYACR